MKTSIVMATFNGDAYVREQVESLLRQSVLPDELIVADDGSQDATVSILQAMANQTPFPVRVIQRETTLGYARNFAEAALLAANDIVFFCDQDDYWEADKVEVVKRWFQANPSKSLAVHNIAICDEKLNVRIGDYFGYLDRNHARHIFLKGCATAIRKELVDAAFPLPIPSDWHHDNRVHAIARIRESSGYIEQVLIKHRVHASQTSGYINPQKKLGGRLLARLMESGLQTSPMWARTMNLIPFLRTQAEILEFLHACGKMDLAPLLLDASARMQQKDALASNPSGRSRIAHAAELSKFYLSGKYKDIGNFPQYLADAIRAIKA